MDWFSWLSKSHLQPPFIHEYAITFSQNQLEQDDILYFNHEFLQSMGISIAKHRLEILKLARKSSALDPMAKLIAVVKKTKRTLAQYVRTWIHRNESATVMIKTRSYSLRWKAAMVKRSNRLVMNKQRPATLLITNGYRPVVGYGGGGKVINSFPGSSVYNLRHDESKEDGGDGGGAGYWSGRSVEKIKWDAMFQNLKPT